MAKKNTDLFDRMRQAGLRKQVAKRLSEIGEGTSKKAVSAARNAVSDLRSLAEEIERRLPGTTPEATPAASTPRRRNSRSSAPAPQASRSRSRSRAAGGSSAGSASAASTSGSSASGRPAAKQSASRRGRATPPRKTAAAPRKTAVAPRKTAVAAGAGTGVARAPRGQNKAKILASLKAGPKTASEIAKETGIGTGTVGTTLSKLATSGDVVKAERGYGLPK
jgi:regulatory ArsR family protein